MFFNLKESYLHLKPGGADLAEAVLEYVLLDVAVVLGGPPRATCDGAPVVPLAVRMQASGPLARLHLEALVGGPCRDGDQVPADGTLSYPLRVPLI